MIETNELKQTLDHISSMIPEAMKTTTSKMEEIAALNAFQILYLDRLETLAEETKHPDFDENFRMLREKIFEVVKMITERL
jgi:hypothetical protein